MNDDDAFGTLIVIILGLSTLMLAVGLILYVGQPHKVECDVNGTKVKFDLPTKDVQDFEYPEGAENCRVLIHTND